MTAWLAENLGTLVMSVVLLAIIAGAILKMRRDRKKGKCSCGCQNCTMSEYCHK